MTQPPNGWGNQPLPPPPENGWQGQQPGQQPPMQSPPSWGPQYQQQFAPPPPPKKGGALKWALGGTALIAVIAITAVVTMSLGGGDKENGGDTGPTNTAGSGSNSEFASANDTGPVTIITEDPSCAAWRPIQDTLADSAKAGWAQRDASIPASVWSPEQREQYRSMGQAMRTAADQTVPLAKLTTHRVMRQLYEQFIAYARAYADAIPTYTPPNDALARAANTATGVLGGICQAIRFGSAAARAPMVEGASAPKHPAPLGDPAEPTRFLVQPDPVCPDWAAAVAQFTDDTAQWRNIPPDIPAGQWSPEQKAVTTAVVPVMRDSANKLEELGQRSDNATLQDLATLAAQYRRAFAEAIPTYSVADNHLYDAGWRATGVIQAACAAAGS
ncbi:hypothetical protein [Mycolicibacterium fortuitum]|uniref:hypothetical protein n=1 Tax=Mycolicibacterium fortuitum TaxID=1766 RepID=UPI000942811F|nr:hypothetical protein [Mycolicibacterium fortuitum]MDG5769782.1 hypothetical protein [Mycolicibacterium fortuitum]MDG5784820.1 hypothetical protein [Mycolicibacterium fortuitum]